MRITLLVTVDVSKEVALQLLDDDTLHAGTRMVEEVLADEVHSNLESIGADRVRVDRYLVPALQRKLRLVTTPDIESLDDQRPSVARFYDAAEALVQWTRMEEA